LLSFLMFALIAVRLSGLKNFRAACSNSLFALPKHAAAARGMTLAE
jgi:hypothetical protein